MYEGKGVDLFLVKICNGEASVVKMTIKIWRYYCRIGIRATKTRGGPAKNPLFESESMPMTSYQVAGKLGWYHWANCKIHR
jgi:hypothetical protein